MDLGIVHWGTFVGACLLLNLTPGSDTVYVVTRAVAQGRLAGWWSAWGISSGCLIHTALAALGLGALLQVYPAAFQVVQYGGVAYLVGLGLWTIVRKSKPLEWSCSTTPFPRGRLFIQGLATNVLNPKVALFFLAFLPPFVDPVKGGPWSFVALGLTFFTTGTLYSLGLVLLASQLAAPLREHPRWVGRLQRGSGAVFVGLGVALATTGNHQ